MAQKTMNHLQVSPEVTGLQEFLPHHLLSAEDLKAIIEILARKKIEELIAQAQAAIQIKPN